LYFGFSTLKLQLLVRRNVENIEAAPASLSLNGEQKRENSHFLILPSAFFSLPDRRHFRINTNISFKQGTAQVRYRGKPCDGEVCLWKIAQLAGMPCRSPTIAAGIVFLPCSQERPSRSSIRNAFPG